MAERDTLEYIIEQIAPKLYMKPVLPNPRTSTATSKFNAKTIADGIYNAKGYLSDDEDAAIRWALQIQDLNQLRQVEQEFVKISDGRTLVEYLSDFLNDFLQNVKVLKHFFKLCNNNPAALESYVYPYAVEMIYQYNTSIMRVGDAYSKKQGLAPAGKSIPASKMNLYYDWFKPYLGTDNYNKWMSIKTNPAKYGKVLNPYAQEEQFKYGASKLIDGNIILLGQLIVATVGEIITLGFATPAIAAWVGLGSASALGLFDAAQEYNLGNKETAGFMAALEVLPFISKIPGVKQLIQNVGKTLAAKIASNVTSYTSEERFILQQFIENADEVQALLNRIAKSDNVINVKNFIQYLKSDPEYLTLSRGLRNMPKEYRDSILSEVYSGTITYEEAKLKLKKLLSAGVVAKPNWKIVAGIKFSEYEINSMNSISKKIWNDIMSKKTGTQTYILKDFNIATKIKGKQTYVVKNITIKSVSLSEAQRILGKKQVPAAWVGGNLDEVIIVSDIFRTTNAKQEFFSTITHEVAHIKDPSFVSPKLVSTYDPYNKFLVPWSDFNLSKNIKDNAKTWFKNYYLHTFEINAITPQVLVQIINATKTLFKSKGAAAALKPLDIIQAWAKGQSVTWTKEALDILGYTGKFSNSDIKAFFDALSRKNAFEYTVLKTKILKQTEYLKQILKNTMKTLY